jgi:hypothetical protein
VGDVVSRLRPAVVGINALPLNLLRRLFPLGECDRGSLFIVPIVTGFRKTTYTKLALSLTVAFGTAAMATGDRFVLAPCWALGIWSDMRKV